MIVVCGVGDAVNNVNCIMGRETDAHIAVHGAVALNLSLLMPALDASKPIILKFTKCDSELATAALLAQVVSSGTALIPERAMLYAIAGSAATAAATAKPGAASVCFCGLESEPGRSLCKSCEQIESGLRALVSKTKKPGRKGNNK